MWPAGRGNMSILIMYQAKLIDWRDAYRKFTKLLLTKNFSLGDYLWVEVRLHEIHIEILYEVQRSIEDYLIKSKMLKSAFQRRSYLLYDPSQTKWRNYCMQR